MFLLFFVSQVALAALPCLSAAGPETIRSRAEALFRRLSFLDGDGVWLLLMQTMDTAARQPHPQVHLLQQQTQHQQRLHRAVLDGGGAPVNAGGGRSGSRSSTRNRAAELDAAAAATQGVDTRPLVGGSTEESSGGIVSDSESSWWLPRVPSPSVFQGTALVMGGESRRPASLLEGRAVFGAGKGHAARECTSAAARLLSMLSAEGAVAEHM